MTRGVRTLVTRAAADADALAVPLRERGLVPICVPLLERVVFVEAVRRDLFGQDLAVLTSPTAARCLGAAMEAGARAPSQLACVGESTAAAAAMLGVPMRPLPPRFTAAALVASLGSLRQVTVFFPHAARPTPGVADALKAAGAELTATVAYANRLPAGASDAIAALQAVDIVTLLSASAARRLARLSPAASPVWRAAVVCIGPNTAVAARSAGLAVARVARPHTVGGIVDAAAELAKDP